MYLLLCCIAVMSILLQSCGSKDTVSATTVSKEKPLPEDAQVYGEYDGKTFYIIQDDNTGVQMYIRRSTGEDVKIGAYGEEFHGVQFHRQNKNIVLIIVKAGDPVYVTTCRIDITKETYESFFYADGFNVSKDGITYSTDLPSVRDKYGNVPESYLKFTFPELFNESDFVLLERWVSQKDADEEKYKEESISNEFDEERSEEENYSSSKSSRKSSERDELLTRWYIAWSEFVEAKQRMDSYKRQHPNSFEINDPTYFKYSGDVRLAHSKCYGILNSLSAHAQSTGDRNLFNIVENARAKLEMVLVH